MLAGMAYAAFARRRIDSAIVTRMACHKNSLQICLLKKKGRPVMTALQVNAGERMKNPAR
jgi:hypothetical protein